MRRRLWQHNTGGVKSTRGKDPWKLIFLKSSLGKKKPAVWKNI